MKPRRGAAHPVNRWLGLALPALALAVLLVVPLWVLPRSGLAAGALVGLAILVLPLHGALLHEAIHGRLLAGARANRLAGRMLAVSSGIAFEVVRYGHLAHHRHNRHALDRPDVIEGDPGVAARLGFYLGLLGGLYAIEVLSTLMSLLPRRVLLARVARLAPGGETSAQAVVAGMQRAIADARLTRARVDGLCVLALYGTAFWLYGAAWPMLLALVAARAINVSLLDNAAHYGTPVAPDAPVRNFHLPRWAAPLILNQHLHGIHHRLPGLPWHQLPLAFAAGGATYDASYVAGVLRQLRGPLSPAAAPREIAVRATG